MKRKTKQKRRPTCETAPQVIDLLHRLGLTENAELVGRWIWVGFDSPPSDEVRQALKDAGFWWSRRYGQWAHNCGHPCRPGARNPRDKYATVSLADLGPDLSRWED